MHGAPVFQVPDESHVQVVEGTLGFPDRIQVKKGLCRMLVGAVACVDNRYLADLAGKPGASFPRMAHYDDVGVIADGPDGIPERFTFLHA